MSTMKTLLFLTGWDLHPGGKTDSTLEKCTKDLPRSLRVPFSSALSNRFTPLYSQYWIWNPELTMCSRSTLTPQSYSQLQSVLQTALDLEQKRGSFLYIVVWRLCFKAHLASLKPHRSLRRKDCPLSPRWAPLCISIVTEEHCCCYLLNSKAAEGKKTSLISGCSPTRVWCLAALITCLAWAPCLLHIVIGFR